MTAVARRFLREGGEDVKIQFLQLLDCNVSVRGCDALGSALRLGGNTSLVTLNLDHNTKIGSEGVRALCRGIAYNKTLRRLSLAYCDVGTEGGEALKPVIAFPASSLGRLNLRGNQIGGPGFKAIASALRRNKALTNLDMSDNRIGPDVDALATFAHSMKYNQKLAINLEHNLIGEAGADALINSGAFEKGVNSTLKQMTVDIDMSKEKFEKPNRAEGGKKVKRVKRERREEEKITLWDARVHIMHFT